MGFVDVRGASGDAMQGGFRVRFGEQGACGMVGLWPCAEGVRVRFNRSGGVERRLGNRLRRLKSDVGSVESAQGGTRLQSIGQSVARGWTLSLVRSSGYAFAGGT